MHILMTYPSSGIFGGIETLIARMSRWLIRNGHKVTLIIKSNEAWADIIDKNVNCIVLENRYRELYYYHPAAKLIKKLNINKPNVVKSFDLSSSWVACQLSTIFGNNCKVVAGIYNPNVFSALNSNKLLKKLLTNYLYLNTFLKVIPANARIFCGIDQIEELEAIHGEKGVLWPIPIDASEFEPAKRKPKKGKIVSIGRLSSMKEYNLYMIEVVKQLLDRGHKVDWVVYGEGEYESDMRSLIKRFCLEKEISIESTIPYKKLWKVMEDAYVFVGMGTSIIEAAMFKVPNIYALPYDREGMTFGSTYYLPKGSLANSTKISPTKRVVDEIERILMLNEEKYEIESEMVLKSIEEFKIDHSMDNLINIIIKDAKPVILSAKSIYLNYLYRIIQKIL